MKKLVSIVVSVYNEEQALARFYQETRRVLEELTWDYEIIFVNDGSTDSSMSVLHSIVSENPKAKIVCFSRNFGHEAAMIAGLDYSQGDCIICMDADLQHPPEYIPKIIQKIEEGYQIINMVRTKNASAGWLKRITSAGFYKVINMLSDVKFENNASDFFGIDRQAAEVLKKDYREKVRFLRGFVQNIGFKKTTIEFEAGVRVAGESKYNIKKLFAFSMNTIMCFSNMPLRLGIYAGIFSAILGFVMMIYTIYSWLKVGTPSGYATIVVLLCFMFAVLFLIVGIIGEYIAILFTELKNRPIYIVGETTNMEESREKNIK